MPSAVPEYFRSTCHPWPCVGFVLPLLALYEVGLLALAGPQTEALRNGADAWFRFGLGEVGLAHPVWAPLLLVALLMAWALHSVGDRPEDLPHLWLGMLLESGLFAWGLWALSRLFFTLTMGGSPLEVPMAPGHETAMARTLRYLGAGVYEETLFRLLLFSGLWWVFQQAAFPGWWAGILAVVGSSLAFASAHHLGPHGDPLQAPTFLFRALAGVAFALLYWLRGFGITVGAHAGYDVLAGVLAAGH